MAVVAGTPERSGGFIEVPGSGSTLGNPSTAGTTLRFRGGMAFNVVDVFFSGTSVQLPVANAMRESFLVKWEGLYS